MSDAPAIQQVLHLVPIVAGSNECPLFLISEVRVPHDDHWDSTFTHLGYDSRDRAFAMFVDGDSVVRQTWDDVTYHPAGVIDHPAGPVVPLMDGTLVQ